MTIRIALALLFIVPAAMTYPWDSDIDWWIFGIAIGVTLIVFAWWRGLFVTNMIGRRWAIWRRNHSKPKARASNDVTLVLHVDDPAGVGLSTAVGSRLRGALRRPQPKGAGDQSRRTRRSHNVDQHDAERDRQPGRTEGPFR